MKFKFADVPVNITEGFEFAFKQYPRSFFLFIGILLGVFVGAYLQGSTDLFWVGVAFIVISIVAAYFLGRKP